MALSRRSFLAVTGTTAAIVAADPPPPALAQNLAIPGQISSIVRHKIGSVEVTALLDGYIEMPQELFIGSDASEAADLATAAFHKPGPQRSPVNAYLINTGHGLVLIDAGAAASLGPTLGRLPAALAAAGVSPEQIDAVLLSHMHPDHIAGAVAPNGAALFPNAELVVAETEYAYWHDDTHLNRAPAQFKPFFLGAQKAAAAYGKRVRHFHGESDVFTSIRSIPLPGHTPGHTGYLISSNSETLLVWADIVHNATYQFARPNWSVAFDVDPQMAAETRRRVLDQVVVDRTLVAGMHLPFPGTGYVRQDGKAYAYVPAEWSYTL